VAATSAANAWAVGGLDRPLILHWNGTAWKRAPLPSPDRALERQAMGPGRQPGHRSVLPALRRVRHLSPQRLGRRLHRFGPNGDPALGRHAVEARPEPGRLPCRCQRVIGGKRLGSGRYRQRDPGPGAALERTLLEAGHHPGFGTSQPPGRCLLHPAIPPCLGGRQYRSASSHTDLALERHCLALSGGRGRPPAIQRAGGQAHTRPR